MSTNFPRADVYISGGSRNNRLFVRMSVEGRKADAQAFLVAGATFLQAGLDAGVDLGFLRDTATGLHDEVQRQLAVMRRDLDGEGIDPDSLSLDFSDLDALISELT